MTGKTVYVSALYAGEGTQSSSDDLKPFLQSSLPIVLFTDTDFTSSVESVKVIKLPTSDLLSFTQSNLELPAQRSTNKDTLFHFQLVNAKPEFLKRAAAIESADYYVWFDCNILRTTQLKDRFVQRLAGASSAAEIHPGKIIAPGCISTGGTPFDKIFEKPIWRFCSSLLIVPNACILPFFQKTNEILQLCWAAGKITWDMNIWAAVEDKNPSMFVWYMADHNDSILEFPRPRGNTRVILLTMIKNESRIIKRLIQSTLPIADAICVCDTGSTDNTVEVLQEYFKTFDIPTKIYNGPEHAWKNFGHNRSASFKSAVAFCQELGWDPETTYALAMDADMELRMQPAFDKSDLQSIGYKIIQKSGSLEYYNTRFMKIAHPWKCAGVTHEYWDGGNTDTFGMDKIFIADVGDGGCKADKFERDVKLLEQGLIDSPNNPRYLFYLAQSYKDSKQLDKAIEFYKKRIDAGGWFEEVWYSMYIIMKLYAEKNMPIDMEYWGMKAYEFRKERSENLLFMTRYFRDKRQYWKAWHYYTLGSVIKKPNDLLFIESDVYGRGFEYERAIIHDYVFPDRKNESINTSIQFFNKYNDYCMYTNLQWFVQKIRGTVSTLPFEDMDDYVATSTAILPLENGNFRLNVRYVNYRIQPNGSYLMMDNGILSGDNPVRTDNYTCVMNTKFEILEPLKKMSITSPSRHNTRIKGLEDVRIFYDKDGNLRCTGTSMEYSYNGKIRQILGRYNPVVGMISDLSDLRPPVETDCEKNWIPYKGDRFIYTWHPFQIGKVEGGEGRLVIEKCQQTPKFFSHVRGSSCIVAEGKWLYAITHIVMYFQPRKYYHIVVKIDSETDSLVAYTDPFYFCGNQIEYCLGFHKVGHTYSAIVSINDRNPVLAQFNDEALHWRPLT
jgi:glycosyltransferase involved in cell wall biosynthesis